MSWILFAGFLLIFASTCTGETGCPDAKEIEPCQCYDPVVRPTLLCEYIYESETLKRVFASVKRYNFPWVEIRHSILNYIPHEMFDGVGIDMLEIENVTLTDLFDEPPKKLQSLKHLRLSESKVLRGVIWQLLEPLTELETLRIREISVKVIKQDFSQYASKSLKDIIFVRTDTTSIKTGVFQKFENLERFYVDYGSLQEIRRDLFPTNGEKIREISFVGHKIKSVPDDMYTGMPNLEQVLLSNNSIESINSAAFEGRSDRLLWLGLEGNPLRCDCQIKWMISSRPRYLFGTCESPGSMKGKQLETLKEEDIRC